LVDENRPRCFFIGTVGFQHWKPTVPLNCCRRFVFSQIRSHFRLSFYDGCGRKRLAGCDGVLSYLAVEAAKKMGTCWKNCGHACEPFTL